MSWFYHLGKMLTGILYRSWYKVIYIGAENQPRDGGYILCCNHRTNLDPILIAQKLDRQLHFMAKEELFQNRFPFIFKNYREECRAAGFRDIRDEVIGRFSTATDSSTVADMAREHGVELFYTQYLRLCTK